MAAPNARPDADPPTDPPTNHKSEVPDSGRESHDTESDGPGPTDDGLRPDASGVHRAHGTGDKGASDAVGQAGDAAELDIDERWSAIVAELGDLDTDSAAGPDDGGQERRIARMFDIGPVGLPDGLGPGRPTRPRGPRDWPVTPEVEALEEAETHFVPPDPPRVFGRDPLLTMAWCLVVGVPVAMLILMMFLRPFPTAIGGVAAFGFLAGLAVLFWRMPHKRDDDEGPGAVV